jgi:hypothetical protein
MPPSPAYNLLCVLCSTANIVFHAARFRASQIAAVTPQKWDLSTKPKTHASSNTANGPHVSNKGTSVEGQGPSVFQERPTGSTLQPRVESSIRKTFQQRDAKRTTDGLVASSQDPRTDTELTGFPKIDEVSVLYLGQS